MHTTIATDGCKAVVVDMDVVGIVVVGMVVDCMEVVDKTYLRNKMKLISHYYK